MKSKVFTRVKVAFMSCLMVVAMTMNVFAASSDKLSSSSGGDLYKLLDSVRTAGLDADASQADKDLLDDVYDAFENAEDDANATQVVITWGSIQRQFSNNTTDSGATGADSNYVALYDEVAELIADAQTAVASKNQTTEEVKQKIDEFDLGIEFDPAAGNAVLKNVKPFISKALSVVVTLALSLLALNTGIDVFYLIVPAIRSFLTTRTDAKGGAGETANGAPKIIWVSDDAADAYKEYEENQKHPLVTYLKKRCITYVAAAIVLYILISGNINGIINVTIGLLDGFINEFTELLSGL